MLLFLISGESSGLSKGAKAGIALAVLIVIALSGGAVAGWFYRKRKGGKHLFDHQQFNNPVYFSSEKEQVQTDNGAASKPTLKFEEEFKG